MKNKIVKLPSWYDYDGYPCENCGMPTKISELKQIGGEYIVEVCPYCFESNQIMVKMFEKDISGGIQ